jgi:hypothetical protein
MAMPADMPAGTSMDEPDRLQLDIGYPGRDVQSGLALHDDGLQRIGIRRAADQKFPPKPTPKEAFAPTPP